MRRAHYRQPPAHEAAAHQQPEADTEAREHERDRAGGAADQPEDVVVRVDGHAQDCPVVTGATSDKDESSVDVDDSDSVSVAVDAVWPRAGSLPACIWA